jgi:hypothetical protein
MKLANKIGGAFAVIALALPSLKAATVVTNSIDVGATITTAGSLITQAKNISDSALATSIGFSGASPDNGAWTTKGSQFVQIAVDNAVLAWELRTYTDNFPTVNFANATEFAATTTTWGFQYGGLKGSIDGTKIPMGWMVLPDTGTNPFGGPDVFDPSTSDGNKWLFLKDRNDQDIPGTPDDESFASFPKYANVAFGSASATTIVRPNLGVGINTENLGSRTAPFYYYVGANFRGAAAATYGTSLKFELINL